MVLVCASSAQAAGGTAVTVRVEGKTRTLLPANVVHVGSGWITRGGAPKGACSSDSAAGALDRATHHRWGGSFDPSFSDYLIDSILGEKYGSKANYYWEIFAGNVAASTGACGIKPHRAEQLLFAAVPLTDYGDYPLAITGAPRKVAAGRSFTIKVVYYDATGKARPIAGAALTSAGHTVKTNSRGLATVTSDKAGTLVLRATHGDTRKGGHQYGYVRAAAVRVSVG